jgi:hypothetical protein
MHARAAIGSPVACAVGSDPADVDLPAVGGAAEAQAGAGDAVAVGNAVARAGRSMQDHACVWYWPTPASGLTPHWLSELTVVQIWPEVQVCGAPFRRFVDGDPLIAERFDAQTREIVEHVFHRNYRSGASALPLRARQAAP